MPFSSPNYGSVTVYIYEPEFDFLKWLVLQKPGIETGGDLFGLWQDEATAVVQLILGPGKDCSRTATSFHQDVAYLREVGGYLTSSQGLCNIGEWHSHHTLGLAEPSAGDQQTVWNHIPSVAGGRFLVFIANIRGTPPKVNIGCFLFNWSKQKMLRGNIKRLPSPSPIRLTVDNTYITSKAEPTQDWTTFLKYEASMQRNNKPVVDSSSPRDGNGISHKLSTRNDNLDARNGNPNARNDNPNARNGNPNARNGSANTRNRDPSTTNVVSNSPKDGNGISNISSTGNGSLGSRNGDMNERNGKANTKNVNPSTPNAESHTSKDGKGISNIPSTRNGNRNVGDGKTNTRNTYPNTTTSNARNENSNIKNSKPNKKNKKFNISNTTSKARKTRSNKKSKTLRHRQRVRKEQEETNEENYGEEDTLLLVDDCEEKELSKCGKIFKRLGEMLTSVKNFFRRNICRCC